MALATQSAFLPPHLVKALARRRRLPAPPFVERFAAALLFSDISGFTALTEKLQARGREGAEEIADVIGAAFKPVLRSIRKWDGSLVNFGGDAVFAVFPGSSSVRRARATAEEIRELFENKPEVTTSAGMVRLSISQVIHYGTISGMHLGHDLRRQYLVAGPAVTTLKRLDRQAREGEVLLSPAARRQVGTERRPSPARARTPAVSPEVVHPYVPRHIHEVDPHFDGEYRRAAIVFFETRGWSLGRYQSFVEQLHRMLDAYEGILISSDISEHGAIWLCAFGAPVAHEHDLERAATTALRVVSEVDGVKLRGALHAGEVANIWLGDRHRRSFEMLGDVLNTAARSLARADWGEVVVTEATRRACKGIETEPHGRYEAKGKEKPLHLHRLVSARAPVREVRSAVPLVGRSREVKQLTAAVAAAQKGRGAVVGIEGDAGLGKSRLKWETAKLARERGFAVHEGRAAPFGAMPYGPIAAMVRHALGIVEGLGTEEVLAAVRVETGRLGLGPAHRHHLAEVLGARYDDSPLPHLDGKGIRLNNMLAVQAFCRALAAEVPRLFVLEDMHWADETTREAVGWLAAGIDTTRSLLLLLYRPGYTPDAAATELSLSALGRVHVRKMLRSLLGPLPPDFVTLVEQRCEGVPLYVEEVVWHFVETGFLVRQGSRIVPARKLRSDDSPGGIESLLRARLDRLSPHARRVAQYASVVGRAFTLEQLAGFPELRPCLEPALDELNAHELVFEVGSNAYIFKHALIRDAAYSSLLARRRRELHRLVAVRIEQTRPAEAAEDQALLGHHWQQAGDGERARGNYLAGARGALASHSHHEAQRLYRAYLELVDEPNLESITARAELADSLDLVGSTDEAHRELVRGVRESLATGDPRARPSIVRRLGTLQRKIGRMEEARATLIEARELARAVGDRSTEGTALGNLGVVHLEQGRLHEAQECFEQTLAIARADGDRRREAVALANMGELHYERGRLDEARATYQRSLALAREVGDRRREGQALANLGSMLLVCGRGDEAHGYYEQALAIAREVGDRGDERSLIGNLSSLHLIQGRTEDALEGYEQELVMTRAQRDRKGEKFVLGNLAIVRWNQGRMKEARDLYEQSLAISRELGDRKSEGSALGDLALLHAVEGRLPEARALNDAARTIHREMGNRMLEGILLGQMGDLELIAGDLRRASALNAQGAACLDGPHEVSLGLLLCRRGHIVLAGGETAGGLLARVRGIMKERSVDATSELGRALARLERAQAGFETGAAMVCGYAPEDLPEGQLQWLRKNRPEAVPPYHWQ